MTGDLIAYYKNRAAEYEKIYLKPERQEALQQAATILQQTFKDKTVFEIACGTGYWTERIAQAAAAIFATDINETVLEIAQAKTYSPATVSFQIADIFNLSLSVRYNNLFGGFIWSHIPLQQLQAFLDNVTNLVAPGGTVVFMDNNYVAGSNLPITRRDAEGNTYQTRTLESGAVYEVLKNFPDEMSLRKCVQDKAGTVDFINLNYYWILIYKTKRA